MSYDAHCYELAALFLPDGTTPETIAVLAQRIQDFVDDEIRSMTDAASKPVTGIQ